MALSKLQVEETLELFVKNFIYETTGMNRKRLFQKFGDVFGRGIVGWHEYVLSIMKEKDVSKEIVDEFCCLIDGNKEINSEYEYRELCEEDFGMARE